MNVNEAQGLANRLMTEHGLRSTGWHFKFDTAVKRFGQCSYHKRTISLSRKLVLANEIEQVLDTILHEIAHALVGPGHHHDHVWKAKCREVGCRPVRCYSAKDVTAAPARYHATCIRCSTVHKIHRIPKTVKSCAAGSCRWATERDALIWIDQKTGRAVNSTITFTFNPSAKLFLAAAANNPAPQTRPVVRRTTNGRTRTTTTVRKPRGLAPRTPGGF